VVGGLVIARHSERNFCSSRLSHCDMICRHQSHDVFRARELCESNCAACIVISVFHFADLVVGFALGDARKMPDHHKMSKTFLTFFHNSYFPLFYKGKRAMKNTRAMAILRPNGNKSEQASIY
jgi:hypothetical protein